MKKHDVVWNEGNLREFHNFLNETHDADVFAGKTNAVLLKPEIMEHAIKKGKLLDIGFGGGHLIRLLSKKFNCYGIDVSNAAVERMEQEGFEVRLGNIKNIPFEMKFNVVTLTDVLEHLPEAQAQIGLQNIKSHLIDDGILIITTPYQENLNNAKVICPDCGAIFHRMGHQRAFDEKSLRELLESNEFEIIEISRLNLNNKEKRFKLLVKVVFRILTLQKVKRLSNTMYGVARCRGLSKSIISRPMHK